jgi:putative heme-binding domain-containing protein
MRDLREKLKARHEGQARYLAALATELSKVNGNAEAGRGVFFSSKIGCYGCHRVAGQGGNVGPDLSQIGRFRTRAELLESIIFPSLVIAPEFRSYTLTTKNGKQVTGLIVHESEEAVSLHVWGHLWPHLPYGARRELCSVQLSDHLFGRLRNGLAVNPAVPLSPLGGLSQPRVASSGRFRRGNLFRNSATGPDASCFRSLKAATCRRAVQSPPYIDPYL